MGVSSPETLILKARLVELAQQYKTLKLQKFVAATAEKAMRDFNVGLNLVKPFFDKLAAAAKGQAADFTAEEVSIAKPVIAMAAVFIKAIANFVLTDSQKVFADKLVNIAVVLVRAAENMEAMDSASQADGEAMTEEAFGIGKDLKSLRTMYDDLTDKKISGFEREQRALRIEDSKKRLSNEELSARLNALDTKKKELLEEIARVEQAYNKQLETLEVEYNKKPRKGNIKKLWLKLIDYKSTGFTDCVTRVNARFDLDRLEKYRANFGNIGSPNASPNTEKALKIADDITVRALEPNERKFVNKFTDDLLSLAEAQRKGEFPHHKIEEVSRDKMSKLSGDGDDYAVLTMVDGIDKDGQPIKLPTIAYHEDKGKNYSATIAHETQHLIQYQKGQIAYWLDDSRPIPWIYDIYDEIEAHKIQFLVQSDSIPALSGGARITKIDDITKEYMINIYPTLPRTALSLDSTLEQIETEWGRAKRDMIGPKAYFAQFIKDEIPIWDWDTYLAQRTLRVFFLEKRNSSLIEALNISFAR